MFTLLPVVMVLTLFYFTQRDVGEIERHANEPDMVVEVVGKQWSWDFNYVSEDVHEPAGVQSFATGEEGAEEALPVRYLPVDQNVETRLESRDVVHPCSGVRVRYKRAMDPGVNS